MLKRALLPLILAILSYGFLISTDFRQVAAGVAIFLFGMLSLEEGFRSFTGGMLENLLSMATDRLYKSLGFGFAATALVQSSGLMGVITISFLSAGLITLSKGFGIVLGANLGTTTGGWLMAVMGMKMNMESLSMPLLAFGVLFVLQPGKNMKGVGYLMAGLGFYFLGMHHMKAGFEAYRDHLVLTRYSLAGFQGVVSFIALGTVATLILQSSHALFFIVIAALAAGQVSFHNAAALVIGANIGTTSTVLFGAIGSNAEGKRLAAAHFFFNFLTALLFGVFFFQVVPFSDWLSDLLGISAQEAGMRLALFHTLFNLFVVLSVLPFLAGFETFLRRIISEPVHKAATPRYLNLAAVDFPDTAVEAVRREMVSMYGDVVAIVAGVIGFSKEEVFSRTDLGEVIKARKFLEEYPIDAAYHDNVKEIFSAVIAFISRASFSWQESQSQRLHWFRNAGRHLLEAVKALKHLQKNLVRYSSSPNPDQRAAYQQIRLELAEMLRELEEIQKSEDEDTIVVMLDHLKLTVAEVDNQLLDRIYKLINEGRITPAMGTSLIKDYGYVSEVVVNLVDAAGTLFGGGGRAHHTAQQHVALDAEELYGIASEETVPGKEAKP